MSLSDAAVLERDDNICTIDYWYQKFLVYGQSNPYLRVILLPDDKFKRFTGLSKEVFWDALCALERAKKKARGGRKSTLGNGDYLLITLMYYRNYNTMFLIAQEYGISEGYVCKIIHKTEIILARDERFALLKHDLSLNQDSETEIVVVDATEVRIERPKKNRRNTTLARKSVTQLKYSF